MEDHNAEDLSSPLPPRRSNRLADRFHAHDHGAENAREAAGHVEETASEDEELPTYEIETPSDEDEADVREAYRLPPQTARKLQQIYEESKAQNKRLRERVLTEQRARLQRHLHELEQGPRDERSEVAIRRLRVALGYEEAVHVASNSFMRNGSAKEIEAGFGPGDAGDASQRFVEDREGEVRDPGEIGTVDRETEKQDADADEVIVATRKAKTSSTEPDSDAGPSIMVEGSVDQGRDYDDLVM